MTYSFSQIAPMKLTHYKRPFKITLFSISYKKSISTIKSYFLVTQPILTDLQPPHIKNLPTLILAPSISIVNAPSVIKHLKTHSISKSKFRKILVENTAIIAPEINKLWLKILKALYIKTKNPKINRINFENSNNVLKCLQFFFFFFFFQYSIFLDDILLLLIAFCFLNSSVSQFYPTLHLRNFVML